MDFLNYKIICAGFPTCVENIEHTSKFGEWRVFPNSVKGWGDGKICWGIFFIGVVENWGGVILTIWTFLVNIYEIKMSMSCVYKEFEVSIKSINCHLVRKKGGIKIWWEILLGRIFQVERMSKFSSTVGTSPISLVGKTLCGLAWVNT